MMNIVAVIVTYNRLDKLKTTVRNSLGESFERIVIVNNNSTDGTQEWVNGLEDDRIIVMNLKENIGGAGGFHVGMEKALEQEDVDWIVCYDDDSYPQSGTISKFREKNFDKNISAVAAAVYLLSGEISTMNRVRFNPFKNFSMFINTFFKKESIYISNESYANTKDVKVDASTFVGFFIRPEIIRKLGLPRKELFIYADDLIYTLTITMHKYQLLFSPEIKFIHDCTTLVNEQDIYTPIWKVYFTFRNRIEMYRISSNWLYLPITLLQIPKWYNKAKFYKNSRLYKKLLRMAIKDAFRKDFSKKLSDVLEIIKKYD